MFPERSKKIFQFFDGTRSLCADPMRIHRQLNVALDGTPNRFLEESRSGDPLEANDAKERVLAAIRTVFPMAPFDPVAGDGALEEDCWAALDAFLEWTEKNAKTAAG